MCIVFIHCSCSQFLNSIIKLSVKPNSATAHHIKKMFDSVLKKMSLFVSFLSSFSLGANNNQPFFNFQAFFFAFVLSVVVLGIFLNHCLQTWISILLCMCNTIDIDLISVLISFSDRFQRAPAASIVKEMSVYRYKPAIIWRHVSDNQLFQMFMSVTLKCIRLHIGSRLSQSKYLNIKNAYTTFLSPCPFRFLPCTSQLWRLGCHWASGWGKSSVDNFIDSVSC